MADVVTHSVTSSEKAAKQHQGKRVREHMTPLAELLAGWQQICHVGVVVDLGHFLLNVEVFLTIHVKLVFSSRFDDCL